MRVTPGTLDRAARLMDALIKTSEARGHAWRITEDGQTSVSVREETLRVFIHEKLTRHELPPPTRPSGSRGTRPWEATLDALLGSRKRYEWRPTGLLTLSIDGAWFTRSVRKNWNDTEHGSLDVKLHEVLAGFTPAAEAIKAHREDWERRRKAGGSGSPSIGRGTARRAPAPSARAIRAGHTTMGEGATPAGVSRGGHGSVG